MTKEIQSTMIEFPLMILLLHRRESEYREHPILSVRELIERKWRDGLTYDVEILTDRIDDALLWWKRVPASERSRLVEEYQSTNKKFFT